MSKGFSIIAISLFLLISFGNALPIASTHSIDKSIKIGTVANTEWTCCVTMTPECKSSIVGSCISCALAETIAEAISCGMELAHVSEDCVQCSQSSCDICSQNILPNRTKMISDTPAPAPAPAPTPKPTPKCGGGVSEWMCNFGSGLQSLATGIKDIIDAIGTSDTETVEKMIPQEGFKKLGSQTRCFIGYNNTMSNWETWPKMMVMEHMSYVNSTVQDQYVDMITDMSGFTGGFDINSQGIHFMEGPGGNFHTMFLNMFPSNDLTGFSAAGCLNDGDYAIADRIVVMQKTHSSWFGLKKSTTTEFIHQPQDLTYNASVLIENIFLWSGIDLLAKQFAIGAGGFDLNVSQPNNYFHGNSMITDSLPTCKWMKGNMFDNEMWCRWD